MVDIDAAIGFVVARGDVVDRARLSWLRAGITPAEEVLARAELGQTAAGGWPAQWGTGVPSVDATCFRIAELDDLNGLARPAASRALDWLANRQRPDGCWEEDADLADAAPPWATPGDPEARFYLTTNATFWLTVRAYDSAVADPLEPAPFAEPIAAAAYAIKGSLEEDGSWPGYLVSGWLAHAVLHRAEWFYEAARISVALTDRVPAMSAADAAWMTAALRRIGHGPEDPLVKAGLQRLDETQRRDGSWASDDSPAFDVHTTLTGIRAVR